MKRCVECHLDFSEVDLVEAPQVGGSFCVVCYHGDNIGCAETNCPVCGLIDCLIEGQNQRERLNRVDESVPEGWEPTPEEREAFSNAPTLETDFDLKVSDFEIDRAKAWFVQECLALEEQDQKDIDDV